MTLTLTSTKTCNLRICSGKCEKYPPPLKKRKKTPNNQKKKLEMTVMGQIRVTASRFYCEVLIKKTNFSSGYFVVECMCFGFQNLLSPCDLMFITVQVVIAKRSCS